MDTWPIKLHIRDGAMKIKLTKWNGEIQVVEIKEVVWGQAC